MMRTIVNGVAALLALAAISLQLSCGRDENPAWMQDSTAPAPITDLSASSPTDSTVTLRWTAPGDDGAEGRASSYDVRYATMVLTTANWVDGFQAVDEPDPSPAGAADSFVVTGLEPDVKYVFAVRASDEVPNWSPVSNLDSVFTGAPQDCTLAFGR